MSDHLATVSAIYEAFGRGDIPAILDHLADDVQWESWEDNSAQKAGVPWMIPRHDRDGVAEFFRVVATTLDIQEFRILALMGSDNQVAAEFVLEADVRTTGRHYRDEEMHLWTFNDQGKVVRFRHYLDTAKHIAATA